MTDAEPKKNSIWREAIACFWRHRKPWLREAAIFFLIVFALDVFAYSDTLRAPASTAPVASVPSISDEQLAQIKAKDAKFGAMLEKQVKGDLMPQNVSKDTSRSDIAAQILQLIAGLVMAYFFALFFLNEELRRGLSRSWSGFFFFAGLIILSALVVLICVTVPLMTLGLVGKFVLPPGLLTVLAYLLAGGIAVYLSVKLSLVGIIAADRVKNPIRESWALTNGNFWRIFGNGLMVTLVLLPVMLTSTIAFGAIPHVGTTGKLIAMAVHSVLSVTYSGVFMAYGCVVYHTLYQERSKAIPSA